MDKVIRRMARSADSPSLTRQRPIQAEHGGKEQQADCRLSSPRAQQSKHALRARSHDVFQANGKDAAFVQPILACWHMHKGLGFEAAWIDRLGKSHRLSEQAWGLLLWTYVQALEAHALPRPNLLTAGREQEPTYAFGIWQDNKTILPEPYNYTFRLSAAYGFGQEPTAFVYSKLPEPIQAFLRCLASLRWQPAHPSGSNKYFALPTIESLPSGLLYPCSNRTDEVSQLSTSFGHGSQPSHSHLHSLHTTIYLAKSFWVERLATYLAVLEKPCTWGQDIELEAMGYLLGRPIWVYGNAGTSLSQEWITLRKMAAYGPQHGIGQYQPIGLYWMGNHYAYVQDDLKHRAAQYTLSKHRIVHVPGDGNCMFYAVCKGLAPDWGFDAWQLRQATVEWLRQHALSHVPLGETTPLVVKMDS